MTDRAAVAPPTRAPVGDRLRSSIPRLFGAGGVRSLGLVAIVAAVWIGFQFITNGLFLSPRNLTVLTVQVSITAILAAGIVMIMVAGHIDLSIGAAVAFCAIAAAVLIEDAGLNVPMAIVATLVVGFVIGLWQGAWVAWSHVPAFIVTLASLLALRGLALLLTGGATRTPGSDITFIASSFIPAEVTAMIFGAAWLGFVYLLMQERSARRAAGIEGSFAREVGPPAAALAVVCLGATFVAFSYRGLPLPVAILLTVIGTVWYLMRHTAFGRHLHAIGGNPEAARYAGINLSSHSFRAFVLMGVLYGVAGLVLVARLNSAPPNAAQGLELNVIAAAVIGGTSLLGGVGTVGGAVLGALLMESLNNGMSLMNLPSYYQQIAIGLVLLVAVFIDIRSRTAA